jgi:hypothetical protein
LPPPRGDAEQRLREIDDAVRIDAPAGLPPLDLATALWAAERLHAVCALAAAGDRGATAVPQQLTVSCPGSRAVPATHFAVDLTFRHLGDLLQQAGGRTQGDPHVVVLLELARAWPLSSVGIHDLAVVDAAAVATIAADEGLRRFYADRILRRGDRFRGSDPTIVQAIAVARGEHREFARSVLAVHDALLRSDPRRGRAGDR